MRKRPPAQTTDTATGTNRFIPRGMAHIAVASAERPVTVSFVLVPNFTLLAFSSAIEPLRIANQLTGKMLFRWQVLSEDGQSVFCSNGTPVGVEGALDIETSSDLILVCAGVEPLDNLSPALPNLLRSLWRRGHVVGGLCTGAYALAQAGILKGHKFTLHWENISSFSERWSDLVPQHSTFCIDRRVVTCAGGVAAAELMLKLIHDRFGPEVSMEVMNMCLLVQRRTEVDNQVASLASRLGTRNEKLVQAVAWLQQRMNDRLDLDGCAESIGVSRRQIERLFRLHLDQTPIEYINGLRLKQARALLAETDMSVTEVAVACGYATTSHFSKSFKRQFGMTPFKFAHFTQG